MSDLFIDRSASRQRMLKELGFASYQKYLASVLWRSIKTSFLRSNPFCCCCEDFAATVHHDRYTRSNLSGGSTKGLHSVCDRCHDAIHLDENRKKRSIKEARRRLRELSNAKK